MNTVAASNDKKIVFQEGPLVEYELADGSTESWDLDSGVLEGRSFPLQSALVMTRERWMSPVLHLATSHCHIAPWDVEHLQNTGEARSLPLGSPGTECRVGTECGARVAESSALWYEEVEEGFTLCLTCVERVERRSFRDSMRNRPNPSALRERVNSLAIGGGA